MKLTSEEIERYSRQIVLRGVGGPGQARLKAARALAIGAGGLGSPALQYLAGAGVGRLGVVDDDAVELSNLAAGDGGNRRIRRHADDAEAIRKRP
jgi:adenylyltransferase/sulfurtransferase